MLEFLAFRLDTVNQCLWRRTDSGEDERIRLSPKPFALLCYLVEHPGRLVTEDEILGAVWPKLYVQPESIKTQLYEIRKVLGDDPKTPRYIETVPRRGYQFIAPVREGPAPDFAAESRPMDRHLVGRERELSELREHLRAASRGQRQVVFVCGEPGIGKTALVDEFQQRAMSEVPTLRIARGQCIEAYGGTEAYYPILEALGLLCVGSAAVSIVEILAAQAPTWLVQFPALVTERHREVLRQEIMGATRERMLREIGTALDAIAAETPLLMVLEDLQWADHSTVDLLSALARRRPMAKLMLIATSRSLDLLPSDHPLKALKQGLLVHQLCQRIDLGPLTEAQIAEYLGAESPQEGALKGLAESVYRHSGGNPLFIVAALDHLTQRGFILRENGSWQFRVPLEEIQLGIPETLRQMIEAQIERLSEKEQLALEAASVQGAAFSASVCAAVINGDPEEYENLYDSMAHRRRIVRAADTQRLSAGSVSGRCEFVHALYREVLYRRQPLRRRSKLHRRIGDRLETLYSQQLSEVGSELAHHFEQSADWRRTIKYLRLAADAAERRYGHREAIALLEHALGMVPHLPESERLASEIETLEKLAVSYVASTDTRSIETYETLIEKAAQHGSVDAEVRALLGLAAPLSWISVQRCADVLDRAVRLSSRLGDPLMRARVLANALARRISTVGWDDREAEECSRACAQLHEARDRRAPGSELPDYSVGLIPLYSSDYRESSRRLIEARAILRETSAAQQYTQQYMSIFPTLVEFRIVQCHLFLGEWGEALRELDAEVKMLDRNGDYYSAQGMRLVGASLHLHAMDFAQVLEICESALPLVRDPLPRAAPNTPPPIPMTFRQAMIFAGNAEIGLGNYERARDNLATAKRDMERSPVILDWYWRLPLEWGFTELSLATGNLAQARADAERFIEATLVTAERTWQALAWEANARVAQKLRDQNRAGDCIAKALLITSRYDVPLAAWRVHTTAADLFAASGNRELSEQHRQRSRETIFKLADSLPRDHLLRAAFLAAPAVSRALGRRP
jgi:DNA-binding winged helix-turn-helix (wHTH) protein/tetratricopeptide (TPR) repeat protein